MRVAALHFHGDPVVGSAEMHLSALNIFFGANGVGKTHILNSIARTLKRDEYERNRSTGYYNHLRIFWHLDIRDGASTGSPQVGSSTNDERLIWRILQPVNDFRGSSAYSRDD
jgi:predicted ATP-dependent endonuclease of OLD family